MGDRKRRPGSGSPGSALAAHPVPFGHSWLLPLPPEPPQHPLPASQQGRLLLSQPRSGLPPPSNHCQSWAEPHRVYHRPPKPPSAWEPLHPREQPAPLPPPALTLPCRALWSQPRGGHCLTQGPTSSQPHPATPTISQPHLPPHPSCCCTPQAGRDPGAQQAEGPAQR